MIIIQAIWAKQKERVYTYSRMKKKLYIVAIRQSGSLTTYSMGGDLFP